MQIPLIEFEKHVDNIILGRGLSYFKCGSVHDLIELKSGLYEAIVEGTDNYTVNITLKDGAISYYSCDCPYDMGPICKHVVAVLYKLKSDKISDENLNLSAKTEQIEDKSIGKNTTISEQINDLLKNISLEEMKSFIVKKAITNKNFRDIVLNHFAKNNSEESKEYYAKRIKSKSRSASKHYGYDDWYEDIIDDDYISDLLIEADEHLEEKNYKSVIYICFAVLEPLVEALEYQDDSDGYIGDSIENAFEMLNKIADEEIDEETRMLLIEYCFDILEEQKLTFDDSDIGIFHLAKKQVKTEVEIEKMLKLLDKLYVSGYRKEVAQSIKYDILLEHRGEIEADRFLEQNITNPDLREKAIQKAIEQNDFQKAINIAHDGIYYNLENKPGLVIIWNNYLLEIAQAQNDKDKIIEYARLLLIEDFNIKQDYYQILKQCVEPEKWNNFVENLIVDIAQSKRGYNNRLIAEIYITEEWWDRLLTILRASPNFGRLAEYEKYLKKDYAKELIEMYSTAIYNYMRLNMGRNHYKNTCGYIRRIIKLGGREQADKIIETLRTEYPRRTAMIEELNKIYIS